MRAVKHPHADHAILRRAQDKLPRLVGIVGWHIGRCLHFAGRFGRGRRAVALAVMPLQSERGGQAASQLSDFIC